MAGPNLNSMAGPDCSIANCFVLSPIWCFSGTFELHLMVLTLPEGMPKEMYLSLAFFFPAVILFEKSYLF